VRARGSELYAKTCALCHGARGEGYVADHANALANQDFLATASDAFLERAIVRGRPGTTMSPWGTAFGGPLTDADARAIVRLVRSWQTEPNVDLTARAAGGGEPLRGGALFAAECAGCHGAEGRGGRFLSLTNPELLASASDAYLYEAIARGRRGTPMPSYAATLNDLQHRDLVAYLRSKAVPPGGPPAAFPVFDATKAVVDPSGPDAAFDDVGPSFVPAARVNEAMAQRARLVILDARPPADYVAAHVLGAQSMPFYAVDSRVDVLPKDVWIVAYCGCPHAESGALAQALRARGFTKVRVLDEGFGHWQAQGYPVRSGAQP
jgi:cytochrome c oxidase cbb3-type subunit 3/ubiquinol-cytochrome c reductase cytochrome c subunit